jgi:probable rRNA maturation factor
MILQIVNESKYKVPRKFLEKWVADCAKELLKKRILSNKDLNLELTIVFLDEKSACKVNLEFRGKNYATDVLSFASIELSSIGELILCPQVLKKQAIEHGLSYQQELGYMLLHGLLHLKGYDHEKSKTDEKIMFGIQDGIFNKLRKKKDA